MIRADKSDDAELRERAEWNSKRYLAIEEDVAALEAMAFITSHAFDATFGDRADTKRPPWSVIECLIWAIADIDRRAGNLAGKYQGRNGEGEDDE